MSKYAIWALVVLAALMVGFIGGMFLSGQREAIADLKSRLAALEKQLAAGSTVTGSPRIQRMAVVQVNDLALRYQQNNPALEQQLEQESARLKPELERLKQQAARGEISEEEATLKGLQLQQAAQQKIMVAIARPIQAAINQIAQEKGYDVVMKREDVVLYYQGAVLDDITEQVWSRMQQLAK